MAWSRWVLRALVTSACLALYTRRFVDGKGPGRRLAFATKAPLAYDEHLPGLARVITLLGSEHSFSTQKMETF
jgi:hypothetical protein